LCSDYAKVLADGMKIGMFIFLRMAGSGIGLPSCLNTSSIKSKLINASSRACVGVVPAPMQLIHQHREKWQPIRQFRLCTFLDRLRRRSSFSFV